MSVLEHIHLKVIKNFISQSKMTDHIKRVCKNNTVKTFKTLLAPSLFLLLTADDDGNGQNGSMKCNLHKISPD
jgi:hypothetical protein